MARRSASTISGSNWRRDSWRSPCAASRRRERRPVGPRRGHGVVGIGDGNDARSEGDIFTVEAVWIASAIVPLVVVADDGDQGREETSPLAQLSSDGRVHPDLRLLLLSEIAGLHDDVVGNAHHADVMKGSAVADGTRFFLREVKCLGDGVGVLDHARDVAAGVGGPALDRLGESKDDVERHVVDHALAARLVNANRGLSGEPAHPLHFALCELARIAPAGPYRPERRTSPRKGGGDARAVARFFGEGAQVRVEVVAEDVGREDRPPVVHGFAHQPLPVPQAPDDGRHLLR